MRACVAVIITSVRFSIRLFFLRSVTSVRYVTKEATAVGSKIDTEICFTLLYSPTTALIKPEALNLCKKVVEFKDSAAYTIWSNLHAEVQERGM